jgi:restriction endonuclease S subunit
MAAIFAALSRTQHKMSSYGYSNCYVRTPKGVNVMIKKQICELANIQMGLVLSRKEAPVGSANAYEYSRLTLKSLDNSGVVNVEHIEPFISTEELNDQTICQQGDIIIRMFAPLNPSIITEKAVGYLIPSQLASIRVTTKSVKPEFIQFFLSQDKVLQELLSGGTGTAQRSIKMSILSNLEVPVISLQKQNMICDLMMLQKLKAELQKALAGEEQLLTKAIVNKLMHDTKEIAR